MKIGGAPGSQLASPETGKKGLGVGSGWNYKCDSRIWTQGTPLLEVGR